MIAIGFAVGGSLLFAVPSSGGARDVMPGAAVRAIASSVKQLVKQSPPPLPQTRPIVTKSGATIPLPIETALNTGVLIVISKGSQKMFVFKDGALWNSSPVSTGKKGKETPTGVYPILQKRRHHRSNLYSNAPMPYMQRMTWDGIAIHEGRLPGYPASHGCIRLPREFASALFKLSGKNTTTVVVTDSALEAASDARRLALQTPMPTAGKGGHLIQGKQPRLADLGAPSTVAASETAEPETALEARVAAREIPARRPSGPTQTIQLVAAGSSAAANAYWAKVQSQFPELKSFEKKVIPAVVNSRKVFRLRVTGPGAVATCDTMRKAGTACFAAN